MAEKESRKKSSVSRWYKVVQGGTCFYAQLLESWNQWLSIKLVPVSMNTCWPSSVSGSQGSSQHRLSDHSHYLTVLLCSGVTGGFSTCESSFIQSHRLLFLPFFLSLVCCKFLFSRQSAFSTLSWHSDIFHLYVVSLQPCCLCLLPVSYTAYWEQATSFTHRLISFL